MSVEPSIQAHLIRGAGLAALALGLGGLPAPSAAAQPEKTTQLLGEVHGQWATAPPATIFTARKILTGNPDRPVAAAVAIAGGLVLSVGTLEAVSGSMGDRPYDIDRRFEGKVVVPGFIDANADPVFAAFAIGTEVIAAEDRKIPGRPARVARSHQEYLARIAEASAKLADPGETLFTWGYEPRVHGTVGRSQLDQASPRRAVVAWNRAGDTLIFNSAALDKYAITEGIPPQARFSGMRQQAVLPFIAKDLFTPRRFAAGIEALRRWLPEKGITAIVQSGALTAVAPQHHIDLALDDPSTPFRTFFITDGTTIFEAARKSDELDEVLRRTERRESQGRGHVQWLPRQVALRAGDRDRFEAAFRIYWDAGYQIHVRADDDGEAGVALSALRDRLAVDRRPDHRLTVTLPPNGSAELAGELSSRGALLTPWRQGLPNLAPFRDLDSVTRGPAYAIQREGELGSIREGGYADFAILEEDPASVAPERRDAIRIWGTVFAGRLQPAPSRTVQ